MGNKMRNRQSLRLHGYDYAQDGVYFVTVCTHRLAHKFGYVVDGEVELNELGQLVAAEWQQTATVRPAVEVDLFVIMPNHIHGLLILSEAGAKRESASGSTIRANSLGAIIAQFKSVVTKRSRELAVPPTFPIWQRNYYDHVVRNVNDLDRIRQYIIANPAHWNEDEYYSD